MEIRTKIIVRTEIYHSLMTDYTIGIHAIITQAVLIHQIIEGNAERHRCLF